MSVPVWELKRGDRFTVSSAPGYVFTFDHMDGFHCFATYDTAESKRNIFNWSGPVDRVEDAA